MPTRLLAIAILIAILPSPSIVADEPPHSPRITVTPLVFSGKLFRLEYGPQLETWALDHWSEERVEALFRDMRRDGIERVLLPLMFEDEAYYPSEVLTGGDGRDHYARLFDLAEAHGMQVLLPGVSHQFHRQFLGGDWDPQAELDVNRRLYREMHERYGGRPNFWGWYIPHEAGDRVHRGNVMLLLRELPPYLKSLTPDKPVVFSPWFTSTLTLGAEATTPEAFAREWDAMLAEIEGLDICAIQDATAPVEEIGEWFAAAAPVFKKHGVELWSVAELFPREPGANLTRAIPPEELFGKLRAAAPYVSGFACWEYQNFLNPASPREGVGALNRAWRDRLEADR